MEHWCDTTQDGDTSLMLATREGHGGCVQLLLDKGAKVNRQNKVSAFRDQPSVSFYHVSFCEKGIV